MIMMGGGGEEEVESKVHESAEVKRKGWIARGRSRLDGERGSKRCGVERKGWQPQGRAVIDGERQEGNGELSSCQCPNKKLGMLMCWRKGRSVCMPQCVHECRRLFVIDGEDNGRSAGS